MVRWSGQAEPVSPAASRGQSLPPGASRTSSQSSMEGVAGTAHRPASSSSRDPMACSARVRGSMNRAVPPAKPVTSIDRPRTPPHSSAKTSDARKNTATRSDAAPRTLRRPAASTSGATTGRRRHHSSVRSNGPVSGDLATAHVVHRLLPGAGSPARSDELRLGGRVHLPDALRAIGEPREARQHPGPEQESLDLLPVGAQDALVARLAVDDDHGGRHRVGLLGQREGAVEAQADGLVQAQDVIDEVPDRAGRGVPAPVAALDHVDIQGATHRAGRAARRGVPGGR